MKNSSRGRRDNIKLSLLLAGLLVVAGAFILLGGGASLPGPRRDHGGTSDDALGSALPATRARWEPASDRARAVAAAWVEAYATGSFRDSPRQAIQRLRPYTARPLLREMASDPGAPALLRQRRRLKQRTRAIVETVHVQDGSRANTALIVVFDYTTITTRRRTSELRTITLGVARAEQGWKVTEVLVP